MFTAGGIVTGQKFIGRQSELDKLNLFFSGINNYSLIGLSRVGKSSLVSELLVRNSELLLIKNCQVVNYTITSSTKERDIYRLFFTKILEVTKRLGTSDLENDAEDILKKLEIDFIDHEKVIDLSDKLYESTRIRFFLIFDEFDNAPDVFQKYLMTLREIITRSKNIKLLTISRTSLAKLFPLGGDGSVFPGSFTQFPLKGFSEIDVGNFRQRLVTYVGKDVNDNVWNSIKFYAGNSPFCLALWANAYLDIIQNKIDYLNDKEIVNKMCEICLPQTDEFLTYLCQALQRLGELKNLINFIDITSVSGEVVDKEYFRTLNSYGVISLDNNTLELPYLNNFLSKRPETVFDYSELYELVPIIDTLIVDCDTKLTTLFGSKKANNIFNAITNLKRDLRAIKVKIDSNIKLCEIDGFLPPEITDAEINLYKQKISECRNYLDCV